MMDLPGKYQYETSNNFALKFCRYKNMRIFLFVITSLFLFSCKSQQVENFEITESISVIETAAEQEIEVIAPKFNILSIVILQSDLINTEFETTVTIENLNEFPVNLISINYELYGDDLLWASGERKNILHVPANSSCETEFRFSMNFMGMNRRMLDNIIAMHQVNFRFSGTAEVDAEYPNISPFITRFDITGLSEVKRSTDTN